MEVKKEIENNKLIIKIEGRIDNNTVPELEKEMVDLNGIEGIIFDFEKVEYISSSGLRFVLKYKKQIDNTKVINCNSEVYDIFAMTGFSEMMEVERALRKISVDGCEKIGEGFYGIIYRIDPETIVKVYKIPDALEMIKKETNLARKAFVIGVPTAISYDIVKVGDLYGAVFELLNAESIVNLINDENALDDFAKKSANLLKDMHKKEVKELSLPDRKQVLIGILNECKNCFDDDTYNKLLALLNSIPDRNTMLHSDFQVKNIMMQNNELLLIDMETLSMGHPIFEFASMYASYEAFACVDKQNTDKFLGMPLAKTTELFNKTFRYYFDDKTEEELKEIELKLSIISYLQVLILRYKYSDLGYGTAKEDCEFSINYLTENAKKLNDLDIGI